MKSDRLKPIPLINDPMGFALDFHQLLFANKVIGPFIYGCCLFYTAIGILSTLHLYVFDGIPLLLKYAIVPSTTPWALSTAVKEYVWIQPVVQINFKTFYWDVTTASEATLTEMRKQIKISKLICILFIIESSINAFFGFVVGYVSDIRSDLYFIDIVFSHNNVIRMAVSIISSISHSIVTLTSISIYLVLKYFSVTCKIQLQLLSDFLERVNVYDARDDEAIKDHLKICAFQHSMLLNQFAKVQDISYVPLIPDAISASVALFGCVMCLYYNLKIQNILYVLLLLSLVGIILLDCCESGQDLEDAFEEFSTQLTKVEWYNWNEDNKRTLRIMLVRCQKKEQMQAINTCFNRTLIITIVRTAYQIFVLLQGRI